MQHKYMILQIYFCVIALVELLWTLNIVFSSISDSLFPLILNRSLMVTIFDKYNTQSTAVRMLVPRVVQVSRNGVG